MKQEYIIKLLTEEKERLTRRIESKEHSLSILKKDIEATEYEMLKLKESLKQVMGELR